MERIWINVFMGVVVVCLSWEVRVQEILKEK